MADSVTPVADLLRATLSDAEVLTDPESLLRRAADTWPLRLAQRAMGADPTPPLCVVRPASVDGVAAALRLLSARGVPVVPFGGGSGVAGGAAPPAGTVVLDLGGLDQIIDLNEEDLSVTVGAGVFLGRLESWLQERGYTTGHYPQSIDLAQVGGLVATRSAGQFSTKYGNIEDLLLGLEAVLPSGERCRISSVPRRAVGPDLRHLWIGSEGALGVITEVTLKIFPVPPERWLQAYRLPDMSRGLEAIRLFMRAGWRPAVVRLHDAMEAMRSYSDLVPPGEVILLLLSEGPVGYAAAEGAAVDAIVTEAGGTALGPAPVEAWLSHRNDVGYLAQLIGAGFVVDTIEVAAGWRSIARIYAEVLERVPNEVPEVRYLSGHSSHSYPQGTNLYFSVVAHPEQNPAAAEAVYRQIWARVMQITLEQGGTICHHHGIGRLRAPWVPQDLGSAYPLLRALKGALDPHGVMNPGALIPR